MTAGIEEIQGEVDGLKHELEKQSRTLVQKSNSKDILTLIDLKANSEDVFGIFEEIKRSVQILTSKQVNMEQSKSFAYMLNEQKLTNYYNT